jgi:hypothetical protein
MSSSRLLELQFEWYQTPMNWSTISRINCGERGGTASSAVIGDNAPLDDLRRNLHGTVALRPTIRRIND